MFRTPTLFIPVVVEEVVFSFVPVGVVEVVLLFETGTQKARKSPKVPLEIATFRFSSPFSRVTAVLKDRVKCTITLPGLKAKINKNSSK